MQKDNYFQGIFFFLISVISQRFWVLNNYERLRLKLAINVGQVSPNEIKY